MNPLEPLRDYWRKNRREILEEHKVPGWVRPAQLFFAYLLLFIAALVIADLLAALATWLLSRYYLWHYGSILLRQKQFVYYSLLILVLCVSLALLHLRVAALMQRHISALWLRSLCMFVSSFMVLLLVGRVVPARVFGPGLFAALPVVLAHAAGGILGFALPPERNPMRDAKWLDRLLA
ncbi:MAG: hypothetical protein GX410_07830 [Elusimicrobia bacterium]|nr:hypothetical protein [Elusimicrobiota bacterium]